MGGGCRVLSPLKRLAVEHFCIFRHSAQNTGFELRILPRTFHRAAPRLSDMRVRSFHPSWAGGWVSPADPKRGSQPVPRGSPSAAVSPPCQGDTALPGRCPWMLSAHPSLCPFLCLAFPSCKWGWGLGNPPGQVLEEQFSAGLSPAQP